MDCLGAKDASYGWIKRLFSSCKITHNTGKAYSQAKDHYIHFTATDRERESLFAISVKQQTVECIHKFKQWQAARKVTRKPSCRWQTCAMLAKSLHGLRNSSGVVSCIGRLPIDSVPMVSYYVLYSNCVCKMHRFRDIRLLKLPWPWNAG